jgi:hypothetical protein
LRSGRREGNKKQCQRQDEKCKQEESMGSVIELFVFLRCFFVERTWLEGFPAMRARCRVGKAETTTAETSCETHFGYLFLGFVVLSC